MSYGWDREHLAWAAGFFDGEGTTFFTTNKSKASVFPILSVSQADMVEGTPAPTLVKFGEAFGAVGYTVYPRTRSLPNVRPQHQLYMGGFERVQAALSMMWPFLGEPKKEQALLVLRRYHKAPHRKRYKCLHGHLLTTDTIAVWGGRQFCRACDTARHKKVR